MTTPAVRFRGWIDSLAETWKDRLRGWMASWLSWGIELLLNIIGKAAAPKLQPFIDTLEQAATIPPELKPIIDELKAPTGQIGAILAQSAGGAIIGGALGSIIDAMFLRFSYDVMSKFHPRILNEAQQIALWLRGAILPDELTPLLRKLGMDDSAIAGLRELSQIRLDPNSVITAWRRDPAKYEKLFRDLRDTGWSQDRIEALKFITEFIPSAGEQTLWLAREVYEPDMVAKYGLHDEMPNYADTDFEKIGVSPDQMKNIWGAHWEHASFMQMVEMLHRGLITEADFWEWFKLVEIVPFWRDKLIQTVYTWPTRVDVRRWWDMRTISEERLRELYMGMGYRGENLEDYIKWTKVYTDFPMMIARFKNGWITEDDIRTWLRGLEIPEDRIDQFIEEKTKPEKPAQVELDRLATATEIMKAVKKEIRTETEGIEMLGDLGYTEDVARFKLHVYGAIEAGSPESYMELKQLTQLYKKALGQKAKVPPDDLVQAEKDVEEAKKAKDEAEEKGLKNEKLAPYLKALSDTEYRYRQFLVQWREKQP